MLLLAEMRLLLVNPDRTLVRTPNLPLGYLAAAARQAGVEVGLVDLSQTGTPPSAVAAALAGASWDVVALQAFSCGYHAARSVARLVRRAAPGTTVVIGGRHVTALPAEALAEEPAFDYVVAGEAEVALIRLLEQLRDGGPVAGIEGVWRREGDREIGLPPGAPPDVDRIPFPAWDLIAPRRYPTAPVGTFVRHAPTAPIVTSRGCPYACAFCAAPANGRGIRFRSAASIADELELLVREHGIREIQVLDDNFTSSRDHAVAVCEEILRRGIRVALSFPNGVRLDRIDRELVRLLSRAGCYSMTVGIDSGSQRVLDAMGRGFTLQQMEEQVQLVKEVSDIRLTGNFILGLPGETRRDLQATLVYARRLNLDRAYFGLYMPLPGSRLFDELRGAGRLRGLDYRSLSPQAPTPSFVPDGLTAAELVRIQRRAFLAFYGRWRILRGIAAEIRGPGHAIFVLRRALRLLRRPREAQVPEPAV